MNIPPGYLKVNQQISVATANKIREEFRRVQHNNEVLILGSDIEFIPFDSSPLDPSIVICGHCGQWAARQTKCKSCGAPVF